MKRVRSELGGSMGYEFDHFYNNRHLCDVLEEMRECYKSRNFSHLKGLIEEAQSMANRMESGLRNKKDLQKLQEETSKARKAYKDLRRDFEKLEKEVKVLESQKKSKS